MNCLRITCLCLAGAVAGLVSAAPTQTAPIDLSQREILFRVANDQSLIIGGAPAGVVASSGVLKVTPHIALEPAMFGYGLFVSGTKNVRLVVNGHMIGGRRVVRADGVVIAVPPAYLHGGANSITIERLDGTAGAWPGTAMFPLRGTGEALHLDAVFGTVTPRQAPAEDPLQPKYDVLWYDCSWVPSMTDALLGASSVWVGARSLDSALQTIVLDFDTNGGQLVVSSVDSGPATAVLSHTVDTANSRLRIALPAPAPAGSEIRVRVNYSGRPDPNGGLFGASYTRDLHGSPSVPLISTGSQPYGGRMWWPNKDLPYDKASTSTQRITIPSGQGWTAISNGSLATVVNNGNGTETWTWVNHHAISSYLISMAITNYIHSSATYTSRDGLTTMPVMCYIYPENAGTEGNGAAGTADVLSFFATTFGEYPFLDEKYFTATWEGSGMEHQTCTSIAAGWVGNGYGIINIHELAHQWHGDKITCRNFDEVWLNEGFATYAEALWREHTGGSASYHSYIDTYYPTSSTPVIGPNSDRFYGSVVYDKGAWVLHMLRHIVGDTNFFASLRTYTADPVFSYGTVLTPDYRGVVEAQSGIGLTQFFNQWLYRPGSDAPGTGGLYEPSAQPAYWFTAGTHKNAGANVLDLHIQQTQPGTPFAMPIDIQGVDAAGVRQTVVVQNSTASADTANSFGTFAPVEVNFDPDKWVLKSMALSVNTCGLPPAQGGTYSRSLRASYGSTPYTWTATSALPPGLTLSSSGVLSGTPTGFGSFTFGVRVQDAASTQRNITLTLEVPGSAASNWAEYR